MDANDAPSSPYQQPLNLQHELLGPSRGVHENFCPVTSEYATTSHIPCKPDFLPDLVLACLAHHLWQPDLITASQVCGTWRHCLAGMPSLWTEVGVKPGMRGPPVEQLLRRSSVRPFAFDAIVTRANVRSIGSALRNHIARCYSLTLRLYDVASPDLAKDLIVALGTPVPLMRSLALYDKGTQESLRARDGWFNGQLFAGIAPELRRFSLMGNLSAFSRCVALRRVVEFQYNSQIFNFSSNALLRQLFPGLTSCSIDSPRRPEYPSSNIYLPADLKELSIGSWERDARWKAAFISHIPHANVPRITISLSMTSLPAHIAQVLFNLAHGAMEVGMRIKRFKNQREVAEVELERFVEGTVHRTRSRLRRIHPVPLGVWNDATFLVKVATLWCSVSIFSLAGSFSAEVDWANLEVLHLLCGDGVSTAEPWITTLTGPPNRIRCPRLQFVHIHGGEHWSRFRRTDVQAFLARHLDLDNGLSTSRQQDNHTLSDGHLTGNIFQPELICVGCELVDNDLKSPNHEHGCEVLEVASTVAEESERNPF